MSWALDRRNFLKTTAAGVAAQALGVGAWPRAAHAAPACGFWGDLVGNIGGWTCANHEGFKVLDIYLCFGASQWETLWLPGNGGGAPGFTAHGMGSPNLALNNLNWLANAGPFPCNVMDLPPSPTDAHFFADQTGGGRIYWGAPAKPIYRRPDILSRCRMVTQFHDLMPHEAAIPYCLTGLTLGNPRMAGTGSAIQRRAREVSQSQPLPVSPLPVSYVLHSGDGFPASMAAATGEHPGSSRPLVIQVRTNNNFVDNLLRANITAESDNLLLAVRHEYRDRLRFRGFGDPIRSAGFEGYWVAAELLKNAPTLRSLFNNNLLVIDQSQPVPVCPTHPTGSSSNSLPGTKTMLHAAASLLSSGPARYVGVMDSGRAGSYDTHGSDAQSHHHVLRTCANFYDVLKHLADIIHHPTDNPLGKLKLDDTMVVINTEFGRTNYVNGSNGRDHWPVGYVSTIIGGPIAAGTGATIRGAIDRTGALEGYTVADHRYSPADVRGAILLAAGVDPFAAGNFGVADFSVALRNGIGGNAQAEIRVRLKEWILGL
jgi:hypothetical protein